VTTVLHGSRIVVAILSALFLFGQLFVGSFHPLVTAGVACGVLSALATLRRLASPAGYLISASTAVAGMAFVGVDAFASRYGMDTFFAVLYMISLVPIAYFLVSQATKPQVMPPNKSLERTREG
jgi:hypothetical protein